MTVPPSLSPAAPRVVSRLLVALHADLLAWTVESVSELLGPVAGAALGREQALPALRACRSRPGPVATLLTVFVLGRSATRAALDAALPRTGTAGASSLGLVEAAGHDDADEVRALVDLRPYAVEDAVGEAGWWVASDRSPAAVEGPLRTDHVLGVGGASITLARCTVRTPVGRALDVGTGSGVQALHASRHAGVVVGTDVSARALAFARFNWELNHAQLPGHPAVVDLTEPRLVTDEPPLPSLELRLGSLLQPVAGQRFDLVVSNPPFVITPRAAGVPVYAYRDGGIAGDGLTAQLVTGLAGALAPGGVGQLLGNWEQHRGESWQDRVGGWLDGSELDGWAVQRDVQDPAEYAETWLRDGGEPPGPAFDAAYQAWLDDFEARGVEAVGFGLVTVRRPRRTGQPAARLRRLEDQPGGHPVGEQLAAALAAHDWLSERDDEQLLASCLQVAPDVTEERHHRPGETDAHVVLLRQGGGFARAVPVSTAVAGTAGACDGQLSLGRITAAVAQLLEQPADQVRTEVLPVVRKLVADGFLVPGIQGEQA